MRRTTSTLIVLICLITLIPAQARTKDTSDVDAIKQLEEDMGNAMVAGDIDKLVEIYADDYAAIGSAGEISTKHELLTDFASFHDKLEWFKNAPIGRAGFRRCCPSPRLCQGKEESERKRCQPSVSLAGCPPEARRQVGGLAHRSRQGGFGGRAECAIPGSCRCRGYQEIRKRSRRGDGGQQHR